MPLLIPSQLAPLLVLRQLSPLPEVLVAESAFEGSFAGVSHAVLDQVLLQSEFFGTAVDVALKLLTTMLMLRLHVAFHGVLSGECAIAGPYIASDVSLPDLVGSLPLKHVKLDLLFGLRLPSSLLGSLYFSDGRFFTK